MTGGSVRVTFTRPYWRRLRAEGVRIRAGRGASLQGRVLSFGVRPTGSATRLRDSYVFQERFPDAFGACPPGAPAYLSRFFVYVGGHLRITRGRRGRLRYPAVDVRGGWVGGGAAELIGFAVRYSIVRPGRERRTDGIGQIDEDQVLDATPAPLGGTAVTIRDMPLRRPSWSFGAVLDELRPPRHVADVDLELQVRPKPTCL